MPTSAASRRPRFAAFRRAADRLAVLAVPAAGDRADRRLRRADRPRCLALCRVVGRHAGPARRGPRGTGALRRSFRLVRGRWWPVAFTLFVAQFLVGVASGVILGLPADRPARDRRLVGPPGRDRLDGGRVGLRRPRPAGPVGDRDDPLLRPSGPQGRLRPGPAGRRDRPPGGGGAALRGVGPRPGTDRPGRTRRTRRTRRSRGPRRGAPVLASAARLEALRRAAAARGRSPRRRPRRRPNDAGPSSAAPQPGASVRPRPCRRRLARVRLARRPRRSRSPESPTGWPRE